MKRKLEGLETKYFDLVHFARRDLGVEERSQAAKTHFDAIRERNRRS